MRAEELLALHSSAPAGGRAHDTSSCGVPKLSSHGGIILICRRNRVLTLHMDDAEKPQRLTVGSRCPSGPPRPSAKHAASARAPASRAHSWPTLLRHLALRCRTTIHLAGTNGNFDRLTEPTPVQAHALELARTAELPP